MLRVVVKCRGPERVSGDSRSLAGIVAEDCKGYFLD